MPRYIGFPSPQMPTNPSAIASSSDVEAASGMGLLFSTIVSYTVNPLVLPPLVYGVVLAHVGAPSSDIALGVGIGTVFLSIIPLAHVGWMRLRGDVRSLEIRDRYKRTEPFLVVLAATLAALLVARSFELQGRVLVLVLLGCHFLNTLFLLVITHWWKISVHCASVAGAVGTLAFVHVHIPGRVMGPGLLGQVVLGAGFVVVPLLAWARVRSRAHSMGQAIAGTGLGLVAPYVELWVLNLTIGL